MGVVLINELAIGLIFGFMGYKLNEKKHDIKNMFTSKGK